MAIPIELPIRQTGNSREEHVNDHNLIHPQINRMVYSGHYDTLQDAVDTAIAISKPLFIKPGSYVLTEPLLINRGYHLHISAYNVRLIAGADMDCLIDFKDCIRCTWRGGWLNVPIEYEIDNCLYIYRDTLQATRNAFYDLNIDGNYNTGIRIGKLASGTQCDHMLFENIECTGIQQPNRIGIYAGDGVYANNLNHTFNHIVLSHHDINAYVDCANTNWNSIYCANANIDFYVAATQFNLNFVRSEGSKRFLKTGGPASYKSILKCENILWNAQELSGDGEWMQIYLSGLFYLNQTTFINPPALSSPVIKCSPSSNLKLNIDGIVTPIAQENLADLSVNVQLNLENYVFNES